jgi:6-phosphogluconolactonase
MKAPLSYLFTITGLIALSAGLEGQSSFVYTNDDVFATNTISAFMAGTNGLTPIPGSPFNTGGGGAGGGGYAVNRIVVAGGKFLMASNGGSHDISVFAIDPTMGTLTPAPASPYSAGSTASFGDISLAASADGKYLFAGVSSNNTVVTFTIGLDGSLTPVASAPVPASPAGMRASADGKVLAVGLPGYNSAGGIAMFSIGASGSLTMVNGAPTFDGGSGYLAGVDIDCADTHVFGSEMTTGNTTVDVFSIGSTGALTRIQGSPFTPGSGANSNVGILSPNDKFLFVSNQASGSVTVFNVNAGALSLVTGSPFSLAPTATNPAGMATDQTGTTLYVANNPNLIYVFNIAVDGSLSEVPGSPFTTNQSGGLLSLATFPAKACAAPPSGGGTTPPPPSGGGTTPPPPPPGGGTPPPPQPPPPVVPPPATDPTVRIDIKNGDGDDDDHNQVPEINKKSHGKIRVAILSSATFSAPGTVDVTSLTFGHSGDEKSLAFCETHREDVNHDKLPDLVCHFDTDKANFKNGDTMGILKGKLLDGTPIHGSESIHIAH